MLTAITTAGLGTGTTRTLVRLHYRDLTLNYAFSGLTARVAEPIVSVPDAIYYPGTGTGYWFGDADTYSSYGMLAKVVEQRGMGFTAGSTFESQGTVTPGVMTRQSLYNYPLTPVSGLTDAPTYTTMTDTWEGMDTGPAVTQYLVQKFTTHRVTTITQPDGTKSVQYSYNRPNQYDDGLIYQDETRDVNNTVLRGSSVTWARGDYDSPRPVRMEATDERGQMTAAEFDYGSYNQVTDVRDYGYGGALLRTTRMLYRNAADYTSRNIFNLVRRVDVWDSSDTTRMSRVEYGHDEYPLTNAQGVVQHDLSYDPFQPPECYFDPELGEVCNPVHNPATNYRGNVTSVTRYTNAATPTGAITETRKYDKTGNLVTASSSCCEQTSIGYTLATQFAYPTSMTRGSIDASARVTSSATYDFNTGLARFATDANGRTGETSYFSETWRPQTVLLPTGGYTSFAYNDAAMSVTETAYIGSAIASQNVKRLNGLGQIRQEDALGQSGTWDIVKTMYDKLGRVWQQTQPYSGSQTLQWSEVFYDALGRVTKVRAADGSESQSFYNEATRPDVASTTAGQTTRVRDAWGRERWARADADGRLVEVVEPNPSGNGSVATGGLVTTYG